jgi:predicted RNA-binding protein associated with RNAse of E/G family
VCRVRDAGSYLQIRKQTDENRQYSISALMKQDNIPEMQIYVKYEIVSFMRRQFSSLKVYIKIGQNRKKQRNILYKNLAILSSNEQEC